MESTLSKLKDAVKSTSGVVASAKALVAGLADALDGLTQDPVAIKALADDLRGRSDDLAAAVVEDDHEPATKARATHPHSHKK